MIHTYFNQIRHHWTMLTITFVIELAIWNCSSTNETGRKEPKKVMNKKDLRFGCKIQSKMLLLNMIIQFSINILIFAKSSSKKSDIIVT